MVIVRRAVRTLIAPNRTRLAFWPVIATLACVPIAAHIARSGGNRRNSVQSVNNSTSPTRNLRFSRRIMPLFGADMRRPLTVDVARTLPAKPGRTDPPPQCAGTDHDALCAQMCGQQWHGPGVGVIAKPAWVAREELAELLVCQDRRRARTTRSSFISQR